MEELVRHIEKQFKDGTTWETYGLQGWHVDHEQIKKCYALENLRPIGTAENLRKGARVLT
jgi:lipid A disaccharide synthetase